MSQNKNPIRFDLEITNGVKFVIEVWPAQKFRHGPFESIKDALACCRRRRQEMAANGW